MILTASHCFDDELDGWEGDVVSRKISYTAGGRSWRCMTGSPANGKCNNAADVWAIRMKNDDAVNDFAVVFTLTPGGEFQNIDASDRASNLYTGSLSSSEKYTFYGRGPDHYDGSGSGVMRYMNDSLNWRGAGHFITDADGVRPCIGDSGGPYYLRGMRSIFGVLSEADSSGQCAKVGGKIAGARLTERVVERINEYRDGEGIQRCTRMSFAPDFWTCR